MTGGRSAGLALALMAAAVPTTPAPERETGAWELVWSQEFDGRAGQRPDPDAWTFDIGTDWGNAQLEYDTDRPENVSLDGEGCLAITARREDHRGCEYTSGRIHTRQGFQREGGRFAARIRLPRGAGIWPAFWLLGGNFGEVGWPDCGEIDVMEYRGQEPTVVHGSLHGPGYSAAECVTASYRLPAGDLSADFHVFAIEWEERSISWWLDDTCYRTVSVEDLPPGRDWVFDHPFFLILNVAVGGHFVGPVGESTTFPQTMLVDWVRVYERRG
ncbi:MAG TPA: glycoside hydrolase family 16 protein [bacterium]|nr:glycoside hydrolase family 16 protein [bacterium]